MSNNCSRKQKKFSNSYIIEVMNSKVLDFLFGILLYRE